nr:transposase domain-containing protein [Clostridium sp. HBUAS56010]
MFNDASGFQKIYLAYLVPLLWKKDSVTETAKANNLNPFCYLEFLLTELMEHQEDTSQDFLKNLLPWSNQIPEICKIKTKA